MNALVLCPHCKKWVRLEGHEHEQQIRASWELHKRVRSLNELGEMVQLPCRLISVKKPAHQPDASSLTTTQNTYDDGAGKG